MFLAGRNAAARQEFDRLIAAGGENEWIERTLNGRMKVALQEKDYAALDRDVAEFSRRFPRSDLKTDVQRIVARSLIERKQYAQATAILEAFPGVAVSAQQAGANTRLTVPDPHGLEDRYLLTLGYEGLKRYDDALATLAPCCARRPGP